jgi:hypothetical protein
VASALSKFYGIEFTGTQVYNHLRKRWARLVKICRLKDLSGSLWDEDNFMVTVAPDQNAEHVKVTSTIP